MNTAKVNRWLTLGANFGVLVGIIFLAFELQQNNELLKAQAEYNFFINRLSNSESLRTSIEFGDLLAKLADKAELTRAEQIRADAYYLNLLLRWQYEYSEIQAGRLDANENFYDVWRLLFNDKGPLPYPGLAEAWEHQKILMPPEFATFMDENIVN